MENRKIQYFVNTLVDNNERITDIQMKLKEKPLTKTEQLLLNAHLVVQDSITDLLRRELDRV